MSQNVVRTVIQWNFLDRKHLFLSRKSTFCHPVKALLRHRKARSAARKRLFRSTGKTCLRHAKSQLAVRQRIARLPQKPRICSRNASCARRRQYCGLTVAYLCISGLHTVYLYKRTDACTTAVRTPASRSRSDACDTLYATPPAPCHAAISHLHKRKKVCPGKAGTYPAFHISYLVVTSEERRTSPAGQPSWWHLQTYPPALRS